MIKEKPAIKILDERVIGQIAAGEVIERPASVVKELVENSIDAEATEIIIDVRDGGKRSIRVTDNGIGMNKEDAVLAFERHSTSKITKIDDLETLRSLGFRGEALASIAAVAKVKLITNPRGSSTPSGTEVRVESSKIKEVKDTGSKEGTSVLIEDLFYNLPVRKKYLKTTRTELSKITDIVTRYALKYPEISFRLIHDDTMLMSTPKTQNELDNIVYIYGRKLAEELLSLDYEDEYLRIRGFISKPAITRSLASHQNLFVNGRFITSRFLSSAIRDGYHNLIMKNRFPIVILSLEINQRDVDVNIHPTKMQVRFNDDKKVYKTLSKAVKNTLEKSMLIPSIETTELRTSDILSLRTPSDEAHRANNLKDVGIVSTPTVESHIQSSIDESIESFPEEEVKVKETLTYEDIELKESEMSRIVPIGQVMNTYIIAQGDENMLVIDQHAAHERVVFERLMKEVKEDTKECQELLMPLTLELSPSEKEILLQNSEFLDIIGFKIEPFGGNTFNIRALPVVLGHMDDKSAIFDIIDELVQIGKTKHKEALKEEILAVVACHSAIRAGEELSRKEMMNLIRELYNTKNPFSCPHGRPSILSMNKRDIEKKFKRR